MTNYINYNYPVSSHRADSKRSGQSKINKWTTTTPKDLPKMVRLIDKLNLIRFRQQFLAYSNGQVFIQKGMKNCSQNIKTKSEFYFHIFQYFQRK